MRFLFVDRIDRLVRDRRARGIKTVSFEEGFLRSPYSRPGEFPRLLVLESVAQLASWLVLYSTDFEKVPLLARLDRVEIRESVVTRRPADPRRRDRFSRRGRGLPPGRGPQGGTADRPGPELPVRLHPARPLWPIPKRCGRPSRS